MTPNLEHPLFYCMRLSMLLRHQLAGDPQCFDLVQQIIERLALIDWEGAQFKEMTGLMRDVAPEPLPQSLKELEPWLKEMLAMIIFDRMKTEEFRRAHAPYLQALENRCQAMVDNLRLLGADLSKYPPIAKPK
jgi:hypothetical protein